MTSTASYLPSYQRSWALVIGSNTYAHCSPLDYACNNAQAVAAALIGKFGFPKAGLPCWAVGMNCRVTMWRGALLRRFLQHVLPEESAGR